MGKTTSAKHTTRKTNPRRHMGMHREQLYANKQERSTSN